jgi:hypothetical protein
MLDDFKAEFQKTQRRVGSVPPKDRPNSNGKATAPIDLAATFTFHGDAPASPPRQLIKNLLPAEGVAVTGGQSGAGKTFIEIHKAVCLSTTFPFFGHKVVERVGTAFVAAEGRGLIPNRFSAALTAKEITDKLPIAWIKQLPDFSSTEGIKLFIRQLKALDERFHGDFGARLGQITIDTVAASFSMKDEDDNAEATKVCNAMRRIGEEVGALMCPGPSFRQESGEWIARRLGMERERRRRGRCPSRDRFAQRPRLQSGVRLHQGA